MSVLARRTRTLRFYATVSVLSGLLTFLLLELLLLVFNDWVFQSSFYQFDPDIGFRVRPYARYGTAIANEFGFNDRDYPHQPPAGTYRILFLGDSFNWMGGPEGNYTALLERDFEALFGHTRVEVISAGYSQTHTGEQLSILKKFGIRYNPHLVVLGFFAGNDFYDALPNRKRIVVGGTTTDVFLDRDVYWILWGQPMVLQSRLFLFLREKWVVYRHFWRSSANLELPSFLSHTASASVKQAASPSPEGTKVTSPPPIRTISLPRETYLQRLFLTMQIADRNRQSAFAENIDYVFQSLLQMRDFLMQHDIQFLVAAYPDEIQVDPLLRQALIDRYRLDASDYEWERAQRLLAGFCADHNIEFFDLLEAFREAHREGKRLYLPNDGHWNEEGNLLTSNLFFELLLPLVSQKLESHHARAIGEGRNWLPPH